MMTVELEARVASAKKRARTEARHQDVHLAAKRTQWETGERETVRQARRDQAAWESALIAAASKRMHSEVQERKTKARAEKERTHWGLDVKGKPTRFKRAVGRHSLRADEEHSRHFQDVKPAEFDDPRVNDALGEDARMILAIGLESTRRHGDPIVTLKLQRLAVELGDAGDLRRVEKALKTLSDAGLHHWCGQRWFNRGGREPVRCHARTFGTLTISPDGETIGGTVNLNSEGQAVASDELRAWAVDKSSRNWGGRRPGAGRPRKQPKEAPKNQESEQRRLPENGSDSPSGNQENARARSARGESLRPVSPNRPGLTPAGSVQKIPGLAMVVRRTKPPRQDQRATVSARSRGWQPAPWSAAWSAPPGKPPAVARGRPPHPTARSGCGDHRRSHRFRGGKR